jgi:hypothetical protein
MIQASTKPDAVPDLLAWLAPTPGSPPGSDRSLIAGRQETSFHDALNNFRHSLTSREYSSPRDAEANPGSNQPASAQDPQATESRSTPATGSESGTQPPSNSGGSFDELPEADEVDSAAESQAMIATMAGHGSVESKPVVNLATGSLATTEKTGQDVSAGRQTGELNPRPAGSIPTSTDGTMAGKTESVLGNGSTPVADNRSPLNSQETSSKTSAGIGSNTRSVESRPPHPASSAEVKIQPSPMAKGPSAPPAEPQSSQSQGQPPVPGQTPRLVQDGTDGAETAASETTDAIEDDTVLPRAAKAAGKEGEPRGNTGRDGQSRGTDGAKLAQQMQNTAHKGPEPSPRLQPLPGADRSLPRENPPATILSSGSLHRPAPPLPATQTARPIHPLDSLLPAPTHTAVSNSVPVNDLRPPVASPSAVLDNIQLRIVNGAMEMRAVRAESMSVVLRPDTHTEMVLNLTMQNGLVDVEARMQRGDGGQLAQQWSQLQQSLSQQGIRLHTLQSAPEQSPAFAEHFDQSPSHQEQPAPRDQEESAWTPSRDKSPNRTAPQPHANLQPADGTFESWA